MNYGEIKKCDIANGEGVRVSLFVSGCTHHCPGCFNQDTWDFRYGQEYTEKTQKEILDALAPGYINRLSLLAGEAAMRDGGYFEKCRADVIAERERTRSELLARGFEVLPSSANFVFARRDGTPGRELFLALRERGVLVRRWDSPRIADWLRITIGSPEDMDALIAALDDILKGA